MIRQLKILAVAASLLGLVSTASAEMEVTGMSRVRAETMENFSTVGSATNARSAFGGGTQIDILSMVVDLNMKYTPDPKVMFFFQPQFVKTFGDGTVGSQGVSVSGGLADSMMDVHQAYTTFMHSDKISYTFGRYEMNYGDEFVIGNVGWNNVRRAFDGLKAHWTINDMVWADVFYNKIKDISSGIAPTAGGAPTVPGDKNFYGIYISAKPAPALSAADIYYLQRVDDTTSLQPDAENRSVTGVRLKGAWTALDYRAEYVTESGNMLPGSTSITSATATDVEVGWTMDNFFGSRVYAHYLTSDKNYDQMYPTGHKWLGYADLFGNRNIQQTHIGWSAKWNDHMSTALDYRAYTRNDANTGVYGLAGTNSAGYAAGTGYGLDAGGSTTVGSEIDLTVKCTHQKGLTWLAGYSQFTAGQYFKDLFAAGTAANSNINWYYVQATTNF